MNKRLFDEGYGKGFGVIESVQGRLGGKIAVITGAGSGMGKAAAIAFAREGAKVVVADINRDAAEEVAGAINGAEGVALAVRADVTSEADLKALVDTARGSFGRIDILVNNAGLFDRYCTSLDTSDEVWNHIFHINVHAVFSLTNLVLPEMIGRGSGSIVNVASVAGLVAGKGGAAYTASKHAVVGYTKHLAATYANEGVKVNAICPGTIRTPLTAFGLDAIRVDNIPAGRFGEAHEVADLAVLMASDEAAFLNGAIVPIDGGFSIL